MLLKDESEFTTLVKSSPGFAALFLILVVLALYIGFRYARTHQMKDLLRQRSLNFGYFSRGKKEEKEEKEL
jgi:hypothetical protein